MKLPHSTAYPQTRGSNYPIWLAQDQLNPTSQLGLHRLIGLCLSALLLLSSACSSRTDCVLYVALVMRLASRPPPSVFTLSLTPRFRGSHTHYPRSARYTLPQTATSLLVPRSLLGHRVCVLLGPQSLKRRHAFPTRQR